MGLHLAVKKEDTVQKEVMICFAGVVSGSGC